MTLEERIRRIEQYIGTSEPEVWVRLRDEIRASLGAPRAVAEPAPTARPADLAYGDGRVSVWREIEAVLVGSDSDVTKPIPTRIRSLVAEVKRLHTERDEARAEVERIMGLLHDKAWMLAACLTIAEGGSARANEPTYLNSPAMDAVRDVVRERDSLRAERDAEQRRAMAAESERDVLREEHTARVLENSDLARERDEAREERDSLRDQLAECQRVLALGEKVDAITKEKIAHLERGVREARWLTQRSEWSPNNSGTRLSASDWTQVEDEYDERRAAWLKEFGS